MTRQIHIQLSGQPEGMDNYCRALQALGCRCRPGYAPAPDGGCAGLVLCGGGDLAPERFGQPDRGSHPPDRHRDEAELALFAHYHARGKPILGICRGMQVINVALGGDLIQDLRAPARAKHAGETDRIHSIRTRPGSWLAQRYGEHMTVNSAHHQAVGALGAGLHPSAWAEEGFPEALEDETGRVLGVQFHPERMAFGLWHTPLSDGAAIWRHFVALCAQT